RATGSVAPPPYAPQPRIHRGLSPAAKMRNVAKSQARSGDDVKMKLEDAVNIEDLHRMAKRRLPKIAFDFIEGGLEDERGLGRNTEAFHKHFLLPRDSR